MVSINLIIYLKYIRGRLKPQKYWRIKDSRSENLCPAVQIWTFHDNCAGGWEWHLLSVAKLWFPFETWEVGVIECEKILEEKNSRRSWKKSGKYKKKRM